MAENTNQTTASSPNQGRWWEGYLVRYLVGSLVGAVSLAILAVEIKGDGHTVATYTKLINLFFDKEKGTTAFIALFVGGGLYCYLASAPITVLHAGRMLKETWIRKAASSIWIFVSVVALITIGLITLDLIDLDIKKLSSGTTLALGVLAFPFLWILFAQWLTWLAMTQDKISATGGNTYFDLFVIAVSGPKDTTNNSEFINYNRRLARQRTQSSSSKEIRETYSHLREHSNSIFIVVLEISLTASLVLLHRLLGGNSPPHFWFIALLGLLLWLTPNVLLWGQANRLEQDLADYPEEYPPPTEYAPRP